MTTTQTHQIYPPFFKPLKFLKKIKAGLLNLNLPEEYLKLFLEPVEIAFKELIIKDNHKDNLYLFKYDKSFYDEDWKIRGYYTLPTDECFIFYQELFYNQLYDNADNYDDIQEYIYNLDAFSGLKFFRQLLENLQEESRDFYSWEVPDMEDFITVYDLTCKMISYKIQNLFDEWKYQNIGSSTTGLVSLILKEFFNETCLRYCWSPHTKIGKKRVEKLYKEMEDY